MIMSTPWLTPIVADSDHAEANAVSYEALTPTELDSDKAGCYISALNYAYEHPDIRNIAVTGPYGAGKSSVLKTWCKAHNGTLRVLTVSLADFDMQRHVDESNGDSSSDEGTKNTGSVEKSMEGANKRGNSSRLTQSFHFFMFKPIFSPVNALNQPI